MVAAAVIGGAVIGGAASYMGAKKSSDASSRATDQAVVEQRRQFDLTRSDTAPYRAIGQQALGALGSIYGFSTPTNALVGPGSEAFAGATPVNAFAPVATTPLGGNPNFNSAQGVLSFNPGAAITSKLGTVGKILDPAASIFGSTHGDENRNLKAFAAESGVMQLPDGRLALPNGAIFDQSQLKDVAGTWYGAVHAPDGNQADWQQKYNSLTTSLGGGTQQNALVSGNAGGGQTSDGVPNSAPLSTGNALASPSQPANALTAPDYSAFIKSPDYQFRKDQGMQGIERSAAAGGSVRSGNALTALANYNSNLAAGEYGDWFNRMGTLAGIGSSAVNTSATAGSNAASGISNALVSGGNARASGISNAYGGINSAVQGGLSNYLLNQQLQRPSYGYLGGYGYGGGAGGGYGSYGVPS